MKNANKFFASVCTLGIVATGLSLVVYAGPCYVQTSTVGAAQKWGCSESFISPTGQACPSIVFPNRTGTPIPTQCGCHTYDNQFGVGTSGNEQSGRMEQGSVTRPCYTWDCCALDGPNIGPGLPLADWIYYECALSGVETSGSATAPSFEPTGADCPESPGE